MTPTLITLFQLKNHLRIVDEVEDADLQGKLEMASAVILDYLKLTGLPDAWQGETDDSPGTGVPPLVQAAALLVAGELYKNREASAADVLSQGVKDLLRRQRDPALA
jgi:hypothetical protein